MSASVEDLVSTTVETPENTTETVSVNISEETLVTQVSTSVIMSDETYIYYPNLSNNIDSDIIPKKKRR